MIARIRANFNNGEEKRDKRIQSKNKHREHREKKELHRGKIIRYGKNKGKNKKGIKFPLLIFEEGTGEVRAEPNEQWSMEDRRWTTFYQPPLRSRPWRDRESRSGGPDQTPSLQKKEGRLVFFFASAFSQRTQLFSLCSRPASKHGFATPLFDS
jgi:hypothetical protein